MGYNTKIYTEQGRRQVYESGARNEYPVEAGTSDATSLSNFGLSHFGSTSGAVTYDLAAPDGPGMRKYLSCEAATTNRKQTVQLSTDGTIQLGGSTNWKIVFDAADEGLQLMSRSTAVWDVVGGGASTSIAFST